MTALRSEKRAGDIGPVTLRARDVQFDWTTSPCTG